MADGSYEYIVRPKIQGAELAKRLWCIIGYAAFLVATLTLVVKLFYGSLLIFPALVATLGVMVLLVFFTWRFLRVEYECSILGSRLTITKIIARSHRKECLELDVKSLFEVGLFTSEASDNLQNKTLHKDYIFISSLESESIYYAIFSEGEDQCALYFETSPEAFTHIKRLNHAAARRAEINSSTNK